MATDEEEREKLSSVIKAIREKIVDPPRTEQSELLTRYLVISEEDVPTASKLGEITEEDRRLARELISQSTPDEQIVSSRQNQATPKKSADATPAQPSIPSVFGWLTPQIGGRQNRFFRQRVQDSLSLLHRH